MWYNCIMNTSTLPKRHHIVELIVNYYHQQNFHTGPYLLSSILRKKYWIIAGRDIIRNCIRKSNICFKVDPKPIFPVMAALPPTRVQETKPFLNTGVDYAGPFYVTPVRRRGTNAQKAYLCLFICLATKALHLEVAMSLESATFLNALQRFVGRRGTVKNMYCDQGRNFIGAANALDDLYKLLSSDSFIDGYRKVLLEHRIEFHFNPPSTPPFGGI